MTETTVPADEPRLSFVQKLLSLGPIWVAGAIAIGPATMASVLSAGANLGFSALWIILASAGFGTFSVFLAARLGLFGREAGIVEATQKFLGPHWAWILVAIGVLASGVAQLVIMRSLAGVSVAMFGGQAGPWSVAWAVVLAIGLGIGGYKALEIGAKIVVSLVVLAFLASLFVIPWSTADVGSAFTPHVPSDLTSALVLAGVIGGAVHIALITMTSYTMRNRGWTRKDYPLAKFDTVSSMFVLFGIYSVAIFAVAAALLHANPNAPVPLTHISASLALGPLVGEHAKWLFLVGLWGAAVSTLGGNSLVPPFLVASKMGWATTVKDIRFRFLIVAVTLLSGFGGFLSLENFLTSLVYVLAFGLVGTTFAIAVVLFLLNLRRATPEPTPTWMNLAGIALLVFTAVVGGNYVYEQVAANGLSDPVTLLVFLFTVFVGGATLVLGVKFVAAREIERRFGHLDDRLNEAKQRLADAKQRGRERTREGT